MILPWRPRVPSWLPPCPPWRASSVQHCHWDVTKWETKPQTSIKMPKETALPWNEVFWCEDLPQPRTWSCPSPPGGPRPYRLVQQHPSCTPQLGPGGGRMSCDPPKGNQSQREGHWQGVMPGGHVVPLLPPCWGQWAASSHSCSPCKAKMMMSNWEE